MSNLSFDPQAFLDMPVDVVFEKRPLLPVTDYQATITDVVPKPWQSKDKYNADGTPKTGISYNISLELHVPPSVAEGLGIKMDKLKLTDSVMLDLNDQGGLSGDPGANRQLRAYREALDMNKPGVVFRARDMIGRMVLCRIKHDEYPLGSGNVSEKPAGVAKL